jgi:uncharacterized membrane protein YfcA
MSVGSAVGEFVGGYLAAWTPTDTLRVILATVKLLRKPASH